MRIDIRQHTSGRVCSASGSALRQPKIRTAAAIALAIAVGTVANHSTAESGSIEEIVVRASKLSTSAERIPVKVDWFDVDWGGYQDAGFQSLIGRAPGLYFESGWGGQFSTPNLRGQQPSPAGDLNVGVFIDGVYQANPTAIDLAPVDIDRVEVARGPQNVQFGHSTLAGAIHFVSPMPTTQPDLGVSLSVGSDRLAAGTFVVSGPLIGDKLLGRMAIGLESLDGTNPNLADPGQTLGGRSRRSVAVQLAIPESNGVQASLALRVTSAKSEQPAVASLEHPDYDCGAIEPASGSWSYYCDAVPVATQFDISPDLPQSHNDTGQALLSVSMQLGAVVLTSETSYYRSKTDTFRDFDASSRGQLFGVCSLDASCDRSSGTAVIDRVVARNEVSRGIDEVTEWSQELRLESNHRNDVRWLLGAAAWRTRARGISKFGVETGDLAINDRLTALIPATPALLGPLSLANFALVADPSSAQVTRSEDFEARRNLALFGALSVPLSEHLGTQLELRASDEKRKLDNRIANFGTGFGDSIPPQTFRDLTARASFQYIFSPSLRTYISAAKGSQSGGINPFPNLLENEQHYDPEYNWTYEFAWLYGQTEGPIGLKATLYYIDWRDAQLLGFPESPGVTNLITQNTAGIRTKGLEASTWIQPIEPLHIEFDFSRTVPKFRNGSDDPGSRRFCGVSGGNVTSTFCEIGPSRSGGNTLVPYIDGNSPARTPRTSWHAAIEVTPAIKLAGRLSLRVDANGQSKVFERSINGAYFGKRSLVDARVSYERGPWKVSVWGRNLGDRGYVRALSSRGGVFYPTVPRPLDAIYADRRRLGLTVSYGS